MGDSGCLPARDTGGKSRLEPRTAPTALSPRPVTKQSTYFVLDRFRYCVYKPFFLKLRLTVRSCVSFRNAGFSVLAPNPFVLSLVFLALRVHKFTRISLSALQIFVTVSVASADEYSTVIRRQSFWEPVLKQGHSGL
jgi:hypothetical protein